MGLKDVKLLTCKNVWSKDHRKLTHQLTYELSYTSGKIERVSMTVDSPFPTDYFGISENPSFLSRYEPISHYLNLLTEADRVGIKGDIKKVVVKEADPVDMTVEEIEAALGKKIKIVSKEG